MDKETLSSYGWIVVLVLVLSVLLALATPFGDFISTAVKNTTKGLFDVQQKAMGVAGLVVDDQSFEDNNSAPTYDHNAPELHPDNGTTPANGDTYEYGDYKYTYFTEYNGWKVSINTTVTDKNQAIYGPILESVNGKPIVYMHSTFRDCISLTTAPVIPNSVTNMYATFYNCTSLTTAPEFPSGVIDISYAFQGCTSLKTYAGSADSDGDFSSYVIPISVTNMSYTFHSCTSLTTAPIIPNNVTSMLGTFKGCTSLTTAPPAIPNGVKSMYCTFVNCTSLTDLSDFIIPSSVGSMSSTFSGCTSLTTAPAIPNSVTNMGSTFRDCISLTTAPAIPEGVTNMLLTFWNCTSITGEISLPCSLANQNNEYGNCPATITYYHTDSCDGSCGA